MAKRTDSNQAEIVAALRQVGASVQCLHTVGKGCPDLLVGFRGHNYLMEVKTMAGKLTEDEKEWGNTWNGQISVVRSVGDAFRVLEVL